MPTPSLHFEQLGPWPLRTKGLIVSFSITQLVGQKRQVSKCKLKEYLFGGKTKEKPANFATR